MINGKAYCSDSQWCWSWLTARAWLQLCQKVEMRLLPRLQWWLYLISSAVHQQHHHGGKAPPEWLGNIHSSHGTSACYCSQSSDSGRHQVELLQSCFSFDSFDVMGSSRYISVVLVWYIWSDLSFQAESSSESNLSLLTFYSKSTKADTWTQESPWIKFPFPS